MEERMLNPTSWDISEKVDFTLHQCPKAERDVAIEVILRYRASDAFAVTLDFLGRSGEISVSWTFARDILHFGLKQATGHGDVQIWPIASSRGSLICVSLIASSGSALLTAPTKPIESWLQRTFCLVPAGEESQSLDWDGFFSSFE
ncbi:SsgA family sporulation/cell division regulator [Streptomyces sp. TX20-6-3]|uniref:SsgA family sporulation/cell division regulator n=1 Tax=Streptomyces sp. TX20-6-3 TaxID=3028705 RepID=UPI0034DF51F6